MPVQGPGVALVGRRAPQRRVDYEDPLEEAVAIKGMVAFYDDRVDVTLGGERREYPRTEIAQAMKDEFSG